LAETLRQRVHVGTVTSRPIVRQLFQSLLLQSQVDTARSRRGQVSESEDGCRQGKARFHCDMYMYL